MNPPTFAGDNRPRFNENLSSNPFNHGVQPQNFIRENGPREHKPEEIPCQPSTEEKFAGDDRPKFDEDLSNNPFNHGVQPENVTRENDKREQEPEDIPSEPSTEEKCQKGRNDAYDRMTREEVPKTEVVHKKYLGGKLVEFGDHCWRNESKETKKGIHVIGTIPSNEIKAYNLVAKEAKMVRGERRGDQETLNTISEVLISSENCILASYKSTDVIVPRICALQPKAHSSLNSPDKVSYIFNLFFLPSNTCYRKLPEYPERDFKCKCKICKGPIDETVCNTIQDYMGMVFIS